MKTLRPLGLLILAFTLFVAAGCGRRDELEHRVRNYEVVEEGSAAGVTTSLGAEQPTLTATNVDTTTDLSLIPGTDTTTTTTAPPGSLAETLAIRPGAATPQRRMPPGGVPRAAQRAAPAPETAPVPTAPARQTPVREEPVPEQPQEQPPAEQTPPPTSTPPTTTSPQPQEDPPPTQTAPPPTQTNPNGASSA